MLSRAVLHRVGVTPPPACSSLATRLHSTAASSFAAPPPPPPPLTPPEDAVASELCSAPLARLPTPALVRSLALHSATCSPPVMRMGMSVLQSQSDALSKEGLLKWAVDKTFYVRPIVYQL